MYGRYRPVDDLFRGWGTFPIVFFQPVNHPYQLNSRVVRTLFATQIIGNSCEMMAEIIFKINLPTLTAEQRTVIGRKGERGASLQGYKETN